MPRLTSGTEGLIETGGARRAFGRLFELLYEVPVPVLPLKKVMHWESVVTRLGIPDSALGEPLTGLCGGYFYNISTRPPSKDEIDKWVELGRLRGATQFLVPTVRDVLDAGALRQRGFIPIPWFIESVYDRHEGIASDFRRQLGGHRYREILRVARKAERDYALHIFEGAELLAKPRLLETVTNLHAFNARKFGHRLNLYSERILRALFDSSLGSHVLICLRTDRATGRPVQTSISLIDRIRSQMYQLVQGIDHERVRVGNNLDLADTYGLCCFAERNGIFEINFGRGLPHYKRRCGANRFLLLNNWLLNPSLEYAGHIGVLAERARASLSRADHALLGSKM